MRIPRMELVIFLTALAVGLALRDRARAIQSTARAAVPAGCPQRPWRAAFDFFGEPCVLMPYPINTTCHNDRGWCIDGVCRPMSGAAPSGHCPSCPVGTERFAPAGAGYCQP